MIREVIIGILGAAAMGLAACSTAPSRHSVRTTAAIPPGWCSRADGTALQPGSPGCDSLTKTYSGEQLRRTGSTDAAHALEMLDPEITVTGH